MGGYISAMLCNIITLPYPIYASFKAIESDDKTDDTQWLTYWVVYSTFSVIESFTDALIFWIPFYFELKLIFLIILQIPKFNVAGTLYSTYIRPFLKQNEKKIDSGLQEIETKGKAAINKGIEEAKKKGVEMAIDKKN